MSYKPDDPLLERPSDSPWGLAGTREAQLGKWRPHIERNMPPNGF